MGPSWENFWPTNTPLAVSAFAPTDDALVTHVYRSLTPASSMVEGDPVGIRTRGDSWETHLFGFHLYYMHWEQAKELVDRLYPKVGIDTVGSLPGSYYLAQNYPNPFNPATIIKFNLPTSDHARLTIYNILGQEIDCLLDRPVSAGEHELRWDGKDAGGESVATGVYLYRLQTSNFTDTRKMLLIK